MEGESAVCLSLVACLLAVFGILWLVDTSLHLCFHVPRVLSLCAHFSLRPISPLCKNTSPIGLGSNLIDYLQRPYFQIVTFTRAGHKDFNIFCEDTIQAITGPDVSQAGPRRVLLGIFRNRI